MFVGKMNSLLSDHRIFVGPRTKLSREQLVELVQLLGGEVPISIFLLMFELLGCCYSDALYNMHQRRSFGR